jgi:hypothetical protein
MESFTGNRLKYFFSHRTLINDQLPFGEYGSDIMDIEESKEEGEEEKEVEEDILYD